MWNEFDCNGKSLLVTNTHLSWKPKDDPTRIKQAEDLLEFVKNESKPAILCGDFNCVYGSNPMRVFIHNGFQDLMEGKPDQDKPTWDNTNPFIQSHNTQFLETVL